MSNNNRYAYDTAEECWPNGHSVPFGNWGVSSNVGSKQNANQFEGWNPGLGYSTLRTQVRESTSLTLRNGSDLTGEVKNAAGVPVPGAQIRLIGINARSASPRFISVETLSQRIKYSKSGIDGAFAFRQIAKGRKILVVIRPGYRPFKQMIDVGSGNGPSNVSVVLTDI